MGGTGFVEFAEKFTHFFFQKKHQAHRVGGFLFLVSQNTQLEDTAVIKLFFLNVLVQWRAESILDRNDGSK